MPGPIGWPGPEGPRVSVTHSEGIRTREKMAAPLVPEKQSVKLTSSRRGGRREHEGCPEVPQMLPLHLDCKTLASPRALLLWGKKCRAACPLSQGPWFSFVLGFSMQFFCFPEITQKGLWFEKLWPVMLTWWRWRVKGVGVGWLEQPKPYIRGRGCHQILMNSPSLNRLWKANMSTLMPLFTFFSLWS